MYNFFTDYETLINLVNVIGVLVGFTIHAKYKYTSFIMVVFCYSVLMLNVFINIIEKGL